MVRGTSTGSNAQSNSARKTDNRRMTEGRRRVHLGLEIRCRETGCGWSNPVPFAFSFRHRFATRRLIPRLNFIFARRFAAHDSRVARSRSLDCEFLSTSSTRAISGVVGLRRPWLWTCRTIRCTGRKLLPQRTEVFRSHLNVTGTQHLFGDQGFYYGIAIDPLHGYLYFAYQNPNPMAIRRLNLDGTNPVSLIPAG